MKKFRLFLMMFVAAVSVGTFAACSDDDDDIAQDDATLIAGDYAGQMKVMGYTDSARSYVTLTRKSSSAVACEVLCEELGLNLSAVILDITPMATGYELSSTTKAVSGSVISNTLTLTFSTGSYTFTFTGTK